MFVLNRQEKERREFARNDWMFNVPPVQNADKAGDRRA